MAAYELLVKFTEKKLELPEIISLMRKISGLEINYYEHTFPLMSNDDVRLPYPYSSVNLVEYDIFTDLKLDHAIFRRYDEGFSISYVPQMFKQHYLVGVSAAALNELGADLPLLLDKKIIRKKWAETRWSFFYH